jgi:DNA-binding transcriptional ArsR family regulator
MKDNDYPITVFAALANPTRWKMLKFLEEKPVRSISKIARAFGISSVAATKHVTVLEKANLITRRKIGKYHRIEINSDMWNKIKLFLVV